MLSGEGVLDSIILISGIVFLVLIVSLVIYLPGKYNAVYRSDFSNMNVCDEDGRRVLYFIEENGKRTLQSAMSLSNPDELNLPYSRIMMVSHLLCPQANNALLLGLGGGSIPKFVQNHFPDVRLDIVEIDPVIVDVARNHFGFQPSRNTRIVIDDSAAYVRNCDIKYDIIYVDAFLSSSNDTDSLGIPNTLKSQEFYKNLKSILSTGGVAVFNMNNCIHMEDDILFIESIFRYSTRLRVPTRTSRILAVTENRSCLAEENFRSNAYILDRQKIPGIHFSKFVALQERVFGFKDWKITN